MTSTVPLYLASASPQRLRLLSAVGLEVRVVASGYQEPAYDGGSVADHVLRLAKEKAQDVLKRLHGETEVPRCWLLACDTVVVCDADVIGKPATAAQAAQYLRRLSGREHVVCSGVVLAGPQGWAEQVVETTVTLRELPETELDQYVAGGEWQGAAGGYRMQGKGGVLVTSVRGSYSNVVGLPLETVYGMLRSRGYPFSLI